MAAVERCLLSLSLRFLFWPCWVPAGDRCFASNNSCSAGRGYVSRRRPAARRRSCTILISWLRIKHSSSSLVSMPAGHCLSGLHFAHDGLEVGQRSAPYLYAGRQRCQKAVQLQKLADKLV